MRWITRKRVFFIVKSICGYTLNLFVKNIHFREPILFPVTLIQLWPPIAKFKGRFLVFLETRLQAYLCSIARNLLVYSIALLSASDVKVFQKQILTTKSVGSKGSPPVSELWQERPQTIKFYSLTVWYYCKNKGDAHQPSKKSTESWRLNFAIWIDDTMCVSAKGCWVGCKTVYVWERS